MTDTIRTVTVYGSCVSRDVIRVDAGKTGLAPGGYIARQSVVSAMSGPVDLPSTPSLLKSSFQRRMVEGDVRSNCMEQIRNVADTTDILLMDLIDERFGVFPVGDGYVTDSDEFKQCGWRSILPERPLISFGSERHLHLFKGSFTRFVEFLVEVAIYDRTYLLLPKFATESLQGDNFEHLVIPPTKRNLDFEPYYAYAKESGISVIRPPEHLTIADKNHLWGLGPVHYADGFYQWVASELRNL